MKKLLLCAVLLAGVGRALAQASDPMDLTGRWQGPAQGSQPGLHLVLLVSKAWTEAGPNMPLYLVRTSAETPPEVPKPPQASAQMAANDDPVFEVATIKPSNRNNAGKGFARRRNLPCHPVSQARRPPCYGAVPWTHGRAGGNYMVSGIRRPAVRG